MTEAQVVQITIAICKREVEKVIGPAVLAHLDDGSPWGRAYFLALRELKAAESFDQTMATQAAEQEGK